MASKHFFRERPQNPERAAAAVRGKSGASRRHEDHSPARQERKWSEVGLKLNVLTLAKLTERL